MMFTQYVQHIKIIFLYTKLKEVQIKLFIQLVWF